MKKGLYALVGIALLVMLALCRPKAVSVPEAYPPLEKDEYGQTQLHFACAQASVPEVQDLINKGGNIEDRDNYGRSALYWAWSNQNQAVIEHLTGLSVKMNDFDRLVLDWQDLARQGGISGAKMIRCKQLLCEGYDGELSEDVQAYVYAIAHSLGIEEIHFFKTTRKSTFASDFGFPKIGIAQATLKDILSLLEGKLDTQRAIYLRQTLYHEMCHIKGKHTTLRSIAKDTDPKSTLALSTELEAELGALYYLYTRDNIAKFGNYVEDSNHPSKQDFHRYISQLYAQLLEKPDAEFEVVVALAKSYYEEKSTGCDLLNDISADIKQVLAARVHLPSEHKDLWVFA